MRAAHRGGLFLLLLNLLCIFVYMKKGLFFLPALALLLAVSCGPAQLPRISAVLDSAESLLNERPDSALALLRSLSPDRIPGRRNTARASLLHSIALDKCYIDLQTDSIIAPAVNWYNHHGTAEEKMKSVYYRGRIDENTRRYKEAIVAFVQAEELSSHSRDEGFKGLIDMAIAHAYQRYYNHELALEYQEKGKQHFLLAGDSLRYYLAVCREAVIRQSMLEWTAADSLFRAAISHTETNRAAHALFLSNYALMKVLQPNPDPDGAISLLQSKIDQCQVSLSVDDYCVFGYALALSGSHSEAESILDQLPDKSAGTSDLDYWRYRIALSGAEYEQAIGFLNNSYDKNDRILETVLSDSMPEALATFYKDRSEKAVQERTNLVKSILLVLLLLSLLGIIIFYKYKARHRRMEEQIAGLTSLSDSLQLKLDASVLSEERRIMELRQQYAKGFKRQFALLDSLCSAYWSPIKKKEKDKIFDEVQNILNVIDKESGRQQELEDLLNSRLDGFMIKMRHDMPAFREQDFRLIAYSVLGFQSKTIASIMGYTDASVNTIKSRLRRAIAESDSCNKDFYLLYL